MLFALNMVVKGWATFLQPIAVTIGAAFTALNLDVGLITDIQSNIWFSREKKKENKDIKEAQKKAKLKDK